MILQRFKETLIKSQNQISYGFFIHSVVDILLK